MEYSYQSRKSWKITVVFSRLVTGRCKRYISNETVQTVHILEVTRVCVC